MQPMTDTGKPANPVYLAPVNVLRQYGYSRSDRGKRRERYAQDFPRQQGDQYSDNDSPRDCREHLRADPDTRISERE